VLIRPDSDNAARVMKALDQFGFGGVGLKDEDFTNPDSVVQLGMPPVRIDVMTTISGVPWEDAVRGKAAGHYGDVPVWFLGREQIIENKRATGRLQDLADLEALGES
jgi:hypothetical protein